MKGCKLPIIEAGSRRSCTALADFIDAGRQFPVSCKDFAHETEKVVTIICEVFLPVEE